MKKLLQGIIEFRQGYLKEYIKNYSHLHIGQAPDVLMITCADSRVAPHVFASTNPGDIFSVKNIGNILPSFESVNEKIASSEAAAIQFALSKLPIKNIVICGHSDCGAMHAILSGMEQVQDPNLKKWLSCSGTDPSKLDSFTGAKNEPDPCNKLSKMNVLQQIEHLKTYPLVQKKIADCSLVIQGWYFDIAKGDVYNYEESKDDFVLIDEEEVLKILARLV